MRALACETIAGIALHDKSSAELLVRMGAGEALVATLLPATQQSTLHRDDRGTVLPALLACRNSAAHSGARPRLVAAGCAHALVSALRVHSSVLLPRKIAHERCKLLEAGCAALRNLAASPEHRAAVMAAGGCDAALLSLRSPHCDVEAAWAACGLLTSLACEPANCAVLLRAGGAAEEAVRALCRFPSETRTGWAVAGLLLRLAEACAIGLTGPAADAVAEGGAEAGASAASALSSAYLAARLPLLEEGVGAALAMHGAADARVAQQL